MQGLILELSLIHNDAAPIHVNLPTEVLIHIFRHLQPRSRRDIRVTHICRLWRLIIHRTPDFWVDMLSASESTTPKTGEDPAPYLTFISRTTPLSYHLDFRGDSIALLEHIPSNDIARLTAIIYTFHGRLLRDIPQMLNLDFPNLRGLVIHHTQTWYTFQLGTMLLEATARPEHFPRLHHLDVPAPLLLPCFAVPSLRSLTVGGLLRDSTQLERFLHTLQQCSQLESLTARHCHMALPTLASSTVVHMPNISSLVVEGAGLALKNPVLRFVTFPSSTRWRVEDPYGYPLSKLFPTPLPAGTFSGLDKLFCKCAIEYRPSHSSLTVSVVGYVQGTPAVTITVQNTVWGLRYGLSGPSVVLPALANLFAASSTTISALELHFDKHIGVAVDDWTDLLRAFPVMSHLDVHINSCRHLLRSLRQRVSPLRSRRSPLCTQTDAAFTSFWCPRLRLGHSWGFRLYASSRSIGQHLLERHTRPRQCFPIRGARVSAPSSPRYQLISTYRLYSSADLDSATSRFPIYIPDHSPRAKL
ncbi:hypothetical protein C8T65DRAFT_104654 [Cerioporus squamosus]|nr:hypothetical protein C8T65DRAFT_104654 [Cerioporus squamosus]